MEVRCTTTSGSVVVVVGTVVVVGAEVVVVTSNFSQSILTVALEGLECTEKDKPFN